MFDVVATPTLYQLRVVIERNNLALWRSPDYIFSRLFVCTFMSLFVSLSFLNLGNSVRDLQFRVFSMYVSCHLLIDLLLTICLYTVSG